MQLILASSSPYRRALLNRLNIPFESQSPAIDESPLPGEAPSQLALRLAIDKAEAVAAQRQQPCLVIGSDQVAASGQQLLGKPGDHARAREQLTASSGKRVEFFTGLALVGAEGGLLASHVEPFMVQFRQLSAEQIEYYLKTEQPYDCAGSFKSEGLGIALFDTLQGQDPTALEGLPLISLTRLLTQVGIDVLGSNRPHM